ncbi:T9SS type A sorting domain-containing protein [Flavobacterium sp. 5]|uniref:T9SS type A sorting domain-containing protein n=1 Tax=Flavobacterium sp. 5 TaxID=2035199 RepID=UPI000C2C0443|nr:T9SS type A sorting domain-containing protein [Flavobacterium sp. 5]PKB17824.1 putative secreted protein (Por secretion system target) [Flavobacterium sp. 5]
MKKKDSLSGNTFKLLKGIKLYVFTFGLIIASFVANAQITISGNNPYCIANNPSYRIDNPPQLGSYDRIDWKSNDPGISFSGDPSPTVLYKVVFKSGNLIASPSYIYAEFYLGSNFVTETEHFNFLTPTPPAVPSYLVTKTSDYCTPQYHFITLNVTTTPNPSPNTSFTIAPRIANSSIVITQTSKNVFELKLPLNGEPYFLYDITRSTSSTECASNTISSTSYSNMVSLNLTNCANNTPAVNYDFTMAPNPYSSGYLTIVAPAITFTGTICRVYNNSGVLKTTFPLPSSSTSFPLKATVGAGLTPGVYIVQITYPNGVVKTNNLIVI